MSVKLFVGYRTRPVENLEQYMPKFAPPNWKDKDKIESEIACKKADFINAARYSPYTGTFDEVFLIDSGNERRLRWVYGESDRGNPSVSLQVRNYLFQRFPGAWGSDSFEDVKSEVVFMGFNPRLFLKILGLECSLPSINKPLPLRMWYSGSEYRDIEEAVLPGQECKRFTLELALKFRRPLDNRSGRAWDELLRDWPGPGMLPEKDAHLTLELAAQLGI